MEKYYRDGIMGVVTGDALGCPVQFLSREEIEKDPVTGMIGHGTYDMPAGTWTDDSSMTLATLISIKENGGVKPEDIMRRFVMWYRDGAYTPFGKCFDNGRATTEAVLRYMKDNDISTCGGCSDHDNGNGSLMRIMPVCLYCYGEQGKGKIDDAGATGLIHQVSGLTHNHIRSKIACGLYYFMVRAILDASADKNGYTCSTELADCLQSGINAGFAFYGNEYMAVYGPESKQKLEIRRRSGTEQSESDQESVIKKELSYYDRLLDLKEFREVPAEDIRSSGYVVDTLEAAVWSLLRTDSFRDALRTAVNLGDI